MLREQILTLKEYQRTPFCAFYVSPGYYYRLRVTARVYTASGVLVESQPKNSDAIWY